MYLLSHLEYTILPMEFGCDDPFLYNIHLSEKFTTSGNWKIGLFLDQKKITAKVFTQPRSCLLAHLCTYLHRKISLFRLLLPAVTGKSAYFVIRKKSLQKLHFSETLADVSVVCKCGSLVQVQDPYIWDVQNDTLSSSSPSRSPPPSCVRPRFREKVKSRRGEERGA